MRNARAMTVAELVVSIAVISVVATAVAGFSYALSSAQAHSQGHYLHMQSARNGLLRLQKLVRESLLITAADDSAVVLWAGDHNNDGYINRNEMILVQWQSQVDEIGVYSVDIADDHPDNYRIKLKKFTDMDSARYVLFNDPRVTYRPLAQGIRQFGVSCEPDPPMSKRADIRIVAGPPRRSERPAALRGAAALLYDQTDRVVWSGSEWVLLEPGYGAGSGGSSGEED